MARFTRDELLNALDHYTKTVEVCSQTGDWAPFADLFIEDVTYIEHAYGIFQGREAVRQWIVDVMKPFPHMRFPHTWVAVDEDNGAIVMEILNVLDHPTEPGREFGFPNITRLVYAGDNLFSSEEDVYNPVRDAPKVVGEWLKAGGVMLAEPMASKHG
ncbi:MULTISPECIES: nuclear transport factor 2 family protein [unclassified Mycolicibacterium]|uniref:nuclear transport factor 2 family protein n=1 Tax=unclassified Mycolicibacterium TaxID=2636767 RepID=UPI0012DFB6BC|nr:MULTISPECIES: nuclear transport factor 2 family protein [unclassified Mycolicibacterium]MUL81254.1 nuclear transport factor 2 family protein [Mycolicibacterium sp. CBMA 329]MUL87020.1 nuclear transport factor 2 family protein [Mycolicibacterium sp. CBMA 331]MUL98697.1 nuclear transport factor 2 family protein [Mycolicibacterium sp. CBMA 334]MUM25560.1 nuclear transport factor 2 family protein [Mycolicibacterium sp. CBMA 295]MUM37317.1 nuclear transport factor 2 family protein [Mycolicibacte